MERPHATTAAYNEARVLHAKVWELWKAPENLKFHFLVARVGSWDGYALVETDDISIYQEIASSYPSLSFQIEPVTDVNDSSIFESVAWRSLPKPQSSKWA